MSSRRIGGCAVAVLEVLLFSTTSLTFAQTNQSQEIATTNDPEVLDPFTSTDSWEVDGNGTVAPPDGGNNKGEPDPFRACMLRVFNEGGGAAEMNCECFNLCPHNMEEEATKEVLRRFNKNVVQYSILIAVYALLFIVGVGGNLLVIVTVFTVMKKDSVTNIFLAGLSVADLVLVIFCMPLKLYEYIGYYWRLGEVLCRGLYYLNDVSFITSVLMLTVISIERYLAICWPMKAQLLVTPMRARIIVVAMCFLALALATPAIPLFAVVPQSAHVPQFAFCTVTVLTISTEYKLWIFYLFVVIFLVPAIVMGFAYGRCCHALWRSMKSNLRMQNVKTNKSTGEKSGKTDATNRPNAQSGKRIKVIKMLLLVLVLFLCCWGQSFIYKMARTFSNQHAHNSYWSVINLAIDTVAMSNSVFNPIIYSMLSSSFRRGFKSVLRCKCKPEAKSSTYATSGAPSRTNSSTCSDSTVVGTTVSMTPGQTTNGQSAKIAETIHM